MLSILYAVRKPVCISKESACSTPLHCEIVDHTYMLCISQCLGASTTDEVRCTAGAGLLCSLKQAVVLGCNTSLRLSEIGRTRASHTCIAVLRSWRDGEAVFGLNGGLLTDQLLDGHQQG